MGAKRILVVDDDPNILNLTSRVLVKSGYEVTPATSGRHALEIIRALTPIDVLLSDVVMPDIQGPALVEAVQQTSPGIACILMSAYSPSSLQLPAGVIFLHKPFQSRELVAAIEECCAQAAKTPDAE
jgi:two-component system, cell cycle sensor histidine kinase and response regulator CckA